MYRQLIHDADANSPIPFVNGRNNTWVVHHGRQQLTQSEIDLGFADVSNNIANAIARSNSGDRIFIHGCGTVDYDGWGIDFIQTDLTIIGVGFDAILDSQSTTGDMFCSVTDCRVYIENIRFHCSELERKLVIDVGYIDNSQLWLNKCKLWLGQSSILVQGGSSLMVDNCAFYEGSSGIRITPDAQEVIIRNSKFKYCGQSASYRDSAENACILFDCNLYPLTEDFVKLICTGNIFEDNLCYPIAERAKNTGSLNEITIAESGMYIDRQELYTLKNNMLKGDNATEILDVNNIDANTIYYNDSEFCDYVYCYMID